MKKNYVAITALVFTAVFSLKSVGQSTIVSAGSSVANSSGSVSGSLGQLGYTYQSSTSGSVDAGVQKAYEIFIVDGVEENSLNLKIQAYPNPTTDLLQLQIDGNSPGDFSYELSDSNGKLLYSARAQSNLTTLDMRAYGASMYFLTIKSASSKTKTFKIVKH